MQLGSPKLSSVGLHYSLTLCIPKAELLQLNRTQFPSLGIFISKKVGNRKNYDHFYYISFKSCILGGLIFFKIQKIPREGN